MTQFAKGAYRATITGQEFTETDYGCQFAIKITVADEQAERERTVFLPLTDAAGQPAVFKGDNGDINLWDQSLEVLAYLGFASTNLTYLDPRHPECYDLRGKVVEAYCSHKQKDDGKVVERWYINIPRALPGKPAEKKTLSRLNSLFGKALADKAKAYKEAKQPAPAPASKPMNHEEIKQATEEALAVDDSDIPF